MENAGALSLLEIAGVVRTAPPAGDSVVILIDHQLEYLSGALRLEGIDAAVAENVRLLAAARRRGVPVLHIVTYGRPGSIFDRQGPFSAIIPELAPAPGEPVIEKKFPSSFHQTELAAAITALGKQSLVISGFMTHMCVSTTVRAALDYGLNCTVIAAATATRDLPDPLGGVVPAGAVQQSALAELADRFALVLPDTGALGW